MALKAYKPVTPGTRGLILSTSPDLWKGRPEKSLVSGISSTGGRNNLGRMTNRNIGSRHKRLYRQVDFKRGKRDIVGTVERLEYDPNRTAYIALIVYEDGEKAYILAPQKLKAGDKVLAGEKADIRVGNALPLANIPLGTVVHNVEMKPGKGGQLARCGGFGSVGGAGSGLCSAASLFGRGSPCSFVVLCHGWDGFQSGSSE